MVVTEIIGSDYPSVRSFSPDGEPCTESWRDSEWANVHYLVLMVNDTISVINFVRQHGEMEKHEKSKLIKVIQDMLWQIGLLKYTRKGTLTLSVAGIHACNLLEAGCTAVDIVRNMFVEGRQLIVRFVRQQKYNISFTPSDLASALLVQSNEMKLKEHYTRESGIRYDIYAESVRMTAKNPTLNKVILKVDALYHAHKELGTAGLLRYSLG